MNTVPSAISPATSTRRHILRSTSTLTLAALGANLRQGVWAAGSGMIRVGLIGCGNRGTGAAINALDADPGAKFIAGK